MATKRNLGIKDVYYALVTKNTATEYKCETPKKLSRAVKVSVTITKNSENLYSDSAKEDTIFGEPTIDVELEIDNLTNEQRADLYGNTVTDGILVEGADDVQKDVALMYRNKRGDGKYQFVTLFVGKFGAEDNEELETDEDSPKHTTKTLKGSFRARELDRAVRCIVKEDELTETEASKADVKAILENFYSKVPMQTADVIP